MANSSQYIQVERRTQGVGLAWTSGFAVAAEVERQYSKSCRRECLSLPLPTLLVETAAMGQHDTSVTFSVDVSVNNASILGRKGNGLLRGGTAGKQQCQNDRDERTHAANVPLLCRATPAVEILQGFQIAANGLRNARSCEHRLATGTQESGPFSPSPRASYALCRDTELLCRLICTVQNSQYELLEPGGHLACHVESLLGWQVLSTELQFRERNWPQAHGRGQLVRDQAAGSSTGNSELPSGAGSSCFAARSSFKIRVA